MQLSAIDSAAQMGQLKMIKWLFENRTEGCSVAAMDLAAMGGQFNKVAT